MQSLIRYIRNHHPCRATGHASKLRTWPRPRWNGTLQSSRPSPAAPPSRPHWTAACAPPRQTCEGGAPAKARGCLNPGVGKVAPTNRRGNPPAWHAPASAAGTRSGTALYSRREAGAMATTEPQCACSAHLRSTSASPSVSRMAPAGVSSGTSLMRICIADELLQGMHFTGRVQPDGWATTERHGKPRQCPSHSGSTPAHGRLGARWRAACARLARPCCAAGHQGRWAGL